MTDKQLNNEYYCDINHHLIKKLLKTGQDHQNILPTDLAWLLIKSDNFRQRNLGK